MKEPQYFVAWPPQKSGESRIFDNRKSAIEYANGGPLLVAKDAQHAVKLAYGKRPSTDEAAKANRVHYEAQDRAFHAKRFTRGALLRKNHGH